MDLDKVVNRARQTLNAVRPSLPLRQNLTQEIEDAIAAEARGYYLPDEDERLREVFGAYLTGRAALWEMIRELRPCLHQKDPRVFGIAFCAAAMLVRSANFLINLAKNRPTVWKKLDEAEPRYGLQRKSFTRIYKTITSYRWMWRYYEATRYYEKNRERLLNELKQCGLPEVATWIQAEEKHLEKSHRLFFERRFSYRLHSFLRRNSSGYTKVMFHLFQISGCAVAEMRQPFKRRRGGKRVSSDVIQEIKSELKPGDVIVTRHDDAMSNLFLPGFWPHAALYLGDQEQRSMADLPENPPHHEILEAKKDGVLFRNLSETLAVDAFVVIRPSLSTNDLATALNRAISHEGKYYDFIFDFRKADRLVCTEVIYRAYHSVGDIQFELTKRSGRLALSAEDLLHQSIHQNQFEVVAIFGVNNSMLSYHDDARTQLIESLQKNAE